jgi:hypothetical protein
MRHRYARRAADLARLMAIAGTLIVVSLVAAAQREAAATATLAGVVLTESSNPQPVRRATVRLSTGANTSTRLVGTDDDGRFAFHALPAGTYTLSATKPGYVPAFHGSMRPGRGPGVPVAITSGSRVDVTLRLLRGAVVAGTITDARGTPIPGIAMHALEISSGGSGTPIGTVTDQRGMYRIFGLAPGDYLVAAIPRLGPAGGSLAITGDVIGVTDAEAQWLRAVAGSGTPGSMPPAGRPVAYAPVFYPGSPDVASAAALTLRAGEEHSGVDMTVRIVPVATISGPIVDDTGQPVTAATISLFPRQRDRPAPADRLVSSGALMLPRGIVTAAGYSIPGVSPGEYTIVARSGAGTRAAAAAPPASATLWSVMDVTVSGTDRSDLLIRLLPGQRISGLIAFDRSTQAPPKDRTVAEVSLSAVGSYLGPASTPRAVVDGSGAFRFGSVPPGSYLLQAALAGGGTWMLKSAMLGLVDLADVPLDVTPGGADLDTLIVTFTDRAAELGGRLLDADNRPVTRYSIVLFTTDQALWRPSGRRIRAVRPATDGSFTVSGLPAGEYAVVAVEDLDNANLGETAFLAQLLGSAFKLTLADGERKRQDLRTSARLP